MNHSNLGLSQTLEAYSASWFETSFSVAKYIAIIWDKPQNGDELVCPIVIRRFIQLLTIIIESRNMTGLSGYPLVMTNIAIENGHL